MAILGSVLGIILSDYAYTHIEASEASLFIYLQPLIYIPLSILLLNERITSTQLLGMVCILIGVWWAERRPTHNKKTPKHAKPILTQFQQVRNYLS